MYIFHDKLPINVHIHSKMSIDWHYSSTYFYFCLLNIVISYFNSGLFECYFSLMSEVSLITKDAVLILNHVIFCIFVFECKRTPDESIRVFISKI